MSAEKVRQAALQDGIQGVVNAMMERVLNKVLYEDPLKQYLPDWEVRVIVGKELWQFVSGDSQHHTRLCNILRQAALTVLHKSSIVSELNIAVKRITAEFESKYGHGEEAVEKFIREIL